MKNITENILLQAKISGSNISDTFEHTITISPSNFNLDNLCQVLYKLNFILIRWIFNFILKDLEMIAQENLEKIGLICSPSGYKLINIFTIFGNIIYSRRCVKVIDSNGKKQYHTLLNRFLPKAQQNKGIVTYSVKELAANLALDMPYRQSEQSGLFNSL